MLTSLVITLTAPTDAALPASLGRAAYKLFLQLLTDYNPTLAAELHNLNGPKPFTTSNLVMGKRAKGVLRAQAEQEGWIRFTGLNEAVSQFLLALAQNPPRKVELDRVILGLKRATLNPAEHLWANAVSYQDFAAPFLLGDHSQIRSSANSQIRLQFVSPTTFRSRQRYIPFPLPERVFGSLLQRWQAFAPIALNPGIERFAEEMVAAHRFDIRTKSVPYKMGRQDGGSKQGRQRRGNWQIGFTGKITYSALNRDRYWLSMLHLLGHYAFYSGVGYQTTTGLGQTRVTQFSPKEQRKG